MEGSSNLRNYGFLHVVLILICLHVMSSSTCPSIHPLKFNIVSMVDGHFDEQNGLLPPLTKTKTCDLLVILAKMCCDDATSSLMVTSITDVCFGIKIPCLSNSKGCSQCTKTDTKKHCSVNFHNLQYYHGVDLFYANQPLRLFSLFSFSQCPKKIWK